ncbi:MAG: RpiB/LacA/LacB family sugar-phosphate isomerase [Candidatus Levyibacteriota bacterium]
MKVYLATDHTGLALKDKVYKALLELGYDVEDCGTYSYNKDDDYPDFIAKAAKAVTQDPMSNRGVIFGGSGQGEAIVANKFKGIRCALFYTPVVPVQTVDIEGDKSTDPFEMLKLTREHNGANMLSIATRFLTEEDVLKAVKLWLDTTDPTGERHLRRIEEIKQIEEKNNV